MWNIKLNSDFALWEILNFLCEINSDFTFGDILHFCVKLFAVCAYVCSTALLFFFFYVKSIQHLLVIIPEFTFYVKSIAEQKFWKIFRESNLLYFSTKSVDFTQFYKIFLMYWELNSRNICQNGKIP